jgi:alkanesulfonate monooxygenase SsuD/methylene tetrahydromethanopterin reductase-like flavin-dependent oxidoreductase (luciferase family)
MENGARGGGAPWEAQRVECPQEELVVRLSLSFMGFAPIASTLPAVRAAERFGLDGVWSAEHIGFHDAVVPSALYLRETERLEVGVVGISTAGRHPGLTAMELSSLAELGPGRVRVQIGTGDPSLVAKLGKEVERPARSTEEFVHALRDALAGREMNVEYPGYAFRGFKVTPLAPPPPVDVMAVRPLMVRTAARVGDGLSISMAASHAYLTDTVHDVESELAAQGRDRTSFRITAVVLGVIAEDLEAGCRQAAPLFSLFEPAMLEYLARGIIDPGTLAGAMESGGTPAVMQILTAEVVDGIALVATPDQLGDALERYAATGIDELAVSIFAAPEEQPAIVEQLARAR